MNQKLILKKVGKVFAVYGVQIWLLLFVANIGIVTLIRFKASAQACMTQNQIDADARCLYVLSGNIYNKGTRANPHHDHPCGMDVTSIIPSFHTSNVNQYLLPNYVGPLCVNTATPSPAPTDIPTQAPTQQPTQHPTAQPTQNPLATKSPTPVPTAVKTRTPSPKPTPTNVATNQPIPPTQTPVPQGTQAAANTDIGRFGSKDGVVTVALASTVPTPFMQEGKDPVSATNYYLIYWSTILSYVSFAILSGVGIYWLVQKIKFKIATSQTVKNINP